MSKAILALVPIRLLFLSHCGLGFLVGAIMILDNIDINALCTQFVNSFHTFLCSRLAMSIDFNNISFSQYNNHNEQD